MSKSRIWIGGKGSYENEGCVVRVKDTVDKEKSDGGGVKDIPS
jgi:hypothetical protein